MDDDIYDKLMKQGFLKKEVDYIKIKKEKQEKLKKCKILNKILYNNYYLDDDDKFISTIISKKEEKNLNLDKILEIKNNNDYIEYLLNKYEIELKDYEYVSFKDLDKIKLGGYLRYIDLDENLKWGGIVIKLIKLNNLSKFKIKLMNSKNNIWTIKYFKFYIFFKNTITSRDKFKKLFIKKANLNF